MDDETKRKIYKYNLEIPVIDINGELAITKDDSRYRMKNLKLALKVRNPAKNQDIFFLFFELISWIFKKYFLGTGSFYQKMSN